MYKEPGVNPIPTASDQLLRLGDVTERGSAHGDEGGAPGAIGLLTKALAHHGLVDGQRLVQQHRLNNGQADA